MSAISYLWEKSMVAVTSLADGEGVFEKRLENAWVSAIIRMELADSSDDLYGDLEWVLATCRKYLRQGKCSPVSESDRLELVEKLVHILIETSSRKDNDL